ncbi:MAG: helix-turn-helix domain-containing protein [Chloroflexi bacterium]|nr:helix-turn-helix domain-containing protein [Chloroflexota bacterium]
MDNGQDSDEKPKKKRGRPPGGRRTSSASAQKRRGSDNAWQNLNDITASFAHGASVRSEEQSDTDDERFTYTLEPEKLSPFSRLLRDIVQHDRSEITRIARELDVTENTIYRWMNGSSEPRVAYLKRIPEVLSEQRDDMMYAINQTFPGVLDMQPTKIREAQKEIYRRVLELAASSDEDDTRFWQVSQALFDYALERLDVERRGIAITYARAMFPHDGRIHSLYEATMRGNPPWSYTLEARGYLGSTTLAGQAAMFQRMQYWSAADVNSRQPVERDEFEQSACAVPILRGSRIAGVLVVSCTQPAFFIMPIAREAVIEYAQLLSIGIADSEFQPIELLDLRPMPSLDMQREQISQTYIGRVLAYARIHGTSRSYAELQVRQEMEKEFEAMVGTKRSQHEAETQQSQNKQEHYGIIPPG